VEIVPQEVVFVVPDQEKSYLSEINKGLPEIQGGFFVLP
jgi:hypothetical protein